MNGSWPIEALKAQSLCARTFAASHLNSYSSYGFDVTNDTYCQVYRGLTGITANSRAAVEATAGIYILYKGTPISAMYCSSNGGATEDSENVTGSAVGYLRGKVDSFEAAAASHKQPQQLDLHFHEGRAGSEGQPQGRLDKLGGRYRVDMVGYRQRHRHKVH